MLFPQCPVEALWKIKAVRRRGEKGSEDVPKPPRAWPDGSLHPAAGTRRLQPHAAWLATQGGASTGTGPLAVAGACPGEGWAKTLLSAPHAPGRQCFPSTARGSFATGSGGVRPVPGLQQIAKLQPCGFLRPAGKFDAGFPDGEEPSGKRGTAQRVPPAASCLAGGGELSTMPAVPCHSPRPQPTPVRFAFSPIPPAKSCPIFYPSTTLGDQAD